MTVPSKYREETPDGVVVTKGLDGNLTVYAKEDFDIFAEAMNGISVTDPNLRTFRREILGNSAELTYDSAGRILIPLHLRKLAGIEENVMIVGAGLYFEIWDAQRLQAYEDKSDPKAQANAWESLNITVTRGK